VAVIWLLCGCYVAVMWLLCGCYVAVMWLLCSCIVAVLRMLCDCCEAVRTHKAVLTLLGYNFEGALGCYQVVGTL
jgi:hypothetical protein